MIAHRPRLDDGGGASYGARKARRPSAVAGATRLLPGSCEGPYRDGTASGENTNRLWDLGFQFSGFGFQSLGFGGCGLGFECGV